VEMPVAVYTFGVSNLRTIGLNAQSLKHAE